MTQPSPLDTPLRRRILVLAVVVLAYILSFFHRFAPVAIAQDLALAFSTTAASLGVLAATYFYVYTVMQIPTGILADTLGPRRILFGGALVAMIGSFLFGMAESLDGALVGRTLIGFGVSVTFISMLKIIAVSFDERRFATLVGVVMLIGNFGSVLAGAPLSWLAGVSGWRSVFIGAGFASLVLGVACWLLVKDSNAANRPRFDRTVVLSSLLLVLKNRHTWPAVGVNFGICGSFFAFAGLWASPLLTQVYGYSKDVAASHMSLFFACFAVGCLLIGSLSDKLGRRKPVLLGAAIVYCLLWLLLWQGPVLTPNISFPLFALMGLATSSFSLSWACAKEVNPPLLSGMSTSVCNMGGFLAAAILQPLVGKVIDWRWNGAMLGNVRQYAPEDYRFGLSLLVLTALFGLVSVFFLRETRCRNVWQGQV